jgi:hypothetical protein
MPYTLTYSVTGDCANNSNKFHIQYYLPSTFLLVFIPFEIVMSKMVKVMH